MPVRLPTELRPEFFTSPPRSSRSGVYSICSSPTVAMIFDPLWWYVTEYARRLSAGAAMSRRYRCHSDSAASGASCRYGIKNFTTVSRSRFACESQQGLRPGQGGRVPTRGRGPRPGPALGSLPLSRSAASGYPTPFRDLMAQMRGHKPSHPPGSISVSKALSTCPKESSTVTGGRQSAITSKPVNAWSSFCVWTSTANSDRLKYPLIRHAQTEQPQGRPTLPGPGRFLGIDAAGRRTQECRGSTRPMRNRLRSRHVVCNHPRQRRVLLTDA